MWNRFKRLIRDWQRVIVIVFCVTLLIFFLRLSGYLQSLEWNTLDILLQLHSRQVGNRKTTIIRIQEPEIQELGQWPISERTLVKLLQTIQAQHPRVIGLSLYRNFSLVQNQKELVKVFPNTFTFGEIQQAITALFSTNQNQSQILTKLEQVSASDLIIDRDGVIRRAFLFQVDPKQGLLPSLGMAVSLKFLEQEGVFPTASPDQGWLQLDQVVFSPFNQNDGGYIRADDRGYQILIDFRSSAHSFNIINYTDILAGHFDPKLLDDHIVLVGSQATSNRDHFYTFGHSGSAHPIQTYSVELQANLASQIVSTVLDERPLIKSWSDFQEYLWILGWGTVVAIWAWSYRQTKNFLKLVIIIGLGIAIAIVIQVTINYVAFLSGWWLSLVPSLLSTSISAICIFIHIYVNKLQECNTRLTNEVKAHSRKLEVTRAELQSAQEKIIFQDKLAALGTLVAGVSHELKNPLHFIVNFADLSLDLTEELRDELNQDSSISPQLVTSDTYQYLDTLAENLSEIQKYSQRANDILQTMLPHPNQQSFDYQLSNIHDLIDSAINLVFHSKKNRENNFNIILLKEYDADIDLIEIIPQSISRALINIIDNAYYALQEKYRLRNHNFTPTLTIKTVNLFKAITISIQDNGPGIPKEIINKVFDPFFTTKPPKQGMGLGLSITYNLITEGNQGKIKLETKVDVFTRFTILLPKGDRNKSLISL
ncbi:CHASE2 domain-containing protein [Pleurocapsa sp. PCC 7319]|uniref:CHASE2 domain-containing protein n=1 Tax=Pleurocapsa sp. PCC 7319 TaxID=118161 RepID=UPI0003820296|nr:CHASE2 domain-containing protein [Pleurocapsa sp. PCC 7319]